jgi:hypothetical protein
MMRDTVRSDLTLELIENVVTRDRVADDCVYIVSPPGPGWHASDNHRERHTTWQRRKPVVLPRLWRRRC